tara:strand:- start:9 stop:272 length:264 start_codon:yes stop_codon:yes gene_type:complete
MSKTSDLHIKNEQQVFAGGEYFSAAHKALDEFLIECENRPFTRDDLAKIHRLQMMPGAYHERYGKRLSAQEESWLKQFDAIHPLEMV